MIVEHENLHIVLGWRQRRRRSLLLRMSNDQQYTKQDEQDGDQRPKLSPANQLLQIHAIPPFHAAPSSLCFIVPRFEMKIKTQKRDCLQNGNSPNLFRVP